MNGFNNNYGNRPPPFGRGRGAGGGYQNNNHNDGFMSHLRAKEEKKMYDRDQRKNMKEVAKTVRREIGRASGSRGRSASRGRSHSRGRYKDWRLIAM